MWHGGCSKGLIKEDIKQEGNNSYQSDDLQNGIGEKEKEMI